MLSLSGRIVSSLWLSSLLSPGHIGLTTRLRPTCDRKMLESWASRNHQSKTSRSKDVVMYKTPKAPVTPHLRPICDRKKCWNRGQIVERMYDWSQRSLVIARVKLIVARSMVMFKTSNLQFQIVWCHGWSYDRSKVATIDRTIGRTMLRLIVRSIVAPHYWSFMPRLLVRSVAGGNDRLIVPSVASRHDWSYIGRWSLPIVARFPRMALATDILQSFVLARPCVKIDRGMRPLLEIVANLADRSQLGQGAKATVTPDRTISGSYDWLRLGQGATGRHDQSLHPTTDRTIKYGTKLFGIAG